MDTGHVAEGIRVHGEERMRVLAGIGIASLVWTGIGGFAVYKALTWRP